MQAERVGSDTMLAQIVRHGRGGATQPRADPGASRQVAGYFVPAVLVDRARTFVVWVLGPEPRLAYAIVNAVAVLIIACPCALGLATPMSIMVGVGRGAQEGVLIKNAEAIERMEKVETLVVDKTGTLTEGKPRLTEICRLRGIRAEGELLALAAAVEQQSEHPIAAAIVQGSPGTRGHAADAGTIFNRSPAVVCRGLDGRGFCREPSFLRQRICRGSSSKTTAELQMEGQTVVFVTIDGQRAGALAVADPIKQSTPEAIHALHASASRSSCSPATTNGPRSRRAQLGIDQVEAGVAPSKSALVKAARERHMVAMAGDGINDAPALAAPMSGSRWAPAPMWRWKAPESRY